MIPPEVIARDRELVGLAKAAQFDVDRFRWEQCEGPDRGSWSRAEYAAECGIAEATVDQSIRAWAASLATANPETVAATVSGPSKGGRGQKQPVTEAVNAALEAGQELVQPTKEQHKAARAKVTRAKPKPKMEDGGVRQLDPVNAIGSTMEDLEWAEGALRRVAWRIGQGFDIRTCPRIDRLPNIREHLDRIDAACEGTLTDEDLTRLLGS